MNLSELQQKLAGKRLKHSFSISRGEIDDKNRRVHLAAATDNAVEHWFGRLILPIDKKSIRADRFASGAAPLLTDHDASIRAMVGVIESYSIDSDGKLRIWTRFSEKAFAEEVFRDIRAGICQSVSIGFLLHGLELVEEKQGELPLYRATSWEPYEASIVAVPADIDAGVGRTKNFIKTGEAEELLKENSHEDQFNKLNGLRAFNEMESIETKEHEIISFAEIFGEGDMARSMVLASKHTTIDDVRTAIRDKRAKDYKQEPKESVEAAALRYGGEVTQLARSTNRYGKLTAFEGANAEQRAFRFGKWALASLFNSERSKQWCNENGLSLVRAQVEKINEKGGFLVPEEFGNDLIDLTEKYGVFRQFSKTQPMQSDSWSGPRITGIPESRFTAESEEGDESDFDVDRVSLTAKKQMVLVPYSSEVSEDAVISIGDEIANLAARSFAKKEDECGFNGDGGSSYGGIVGVRERLKGLDGTIGNIAGLQVGSGNAYSELTLDDFTGVVARLPEYADQGAAWYVHRSFYFNTMVRIALDAGGVTAKEVEDTRNRTFLGYPVRFSQVMPKAEANSQVCTVFGDLAMGSLFGDRRLFTMAISEHVLFQSDDLLFKATSRFDINVHSVGNASATAALREAGPIVGLITAGS